jgi:hypothetical protein
MKYLMLVRVDPTIELDEAPDDVNVWVENAGSRRLLGNALRSPDEGWTVRLRGGKPFVTDGPFADTKEFIAGFDILECETKDEALAIAAAHPVAKFGAIEVRAFWDE